MEFILHCIDKPDGGRARLQLRAAHLQYVSSRQHFFRYGGPLIDDAGHVRGSLMILSFPDRAALDEHLRGDPFFSGELFESVAIWASRQVVPEMAPGLLQAEIERELRPVPLASS